MNSIWTNKLTKGEKVIKDFSYSDRWVLVTTCAGILWGIILLPVFGLGIFFFIMAASNWFLTRKRFRYAFTNKRVMLFSRFFSTNLTSIPLTSITDIHVRQNWFDKLAYGVGDLLIETPGKASVSVIRHVADPYAVMQELNELKDAAK